MPVQRLRQKIVRAQDEGAVPSYVSGVAGQHYHGEKTQARPGTSEAPQNFQAVRLWHV
jgi:hypothetical protein